MSKRVVKSIHTVSSFLNVNTEFRHYRLAIPEHPPILLSNGLWLHTYCLTPYNDEEVAGDLEIESEAFDRELLG